MAQTFSANNLRPTPSFTKAHSVTSSLAVLNRSRSGASLIAIQHNNPQQQAPLPTFNARRVSAQSSGGANPLQTAKWTDLESNSPPQPEKRPPKAYHQRNKSGGGFLLHDDFVTMVVNEVCSQAGNKLNVVDTLATFEQVMQQRYPTMSKDVRMRIQKSLMAKLNNSSARQHSSSLASTMNQDLEFDFQGSFGEAIKLGAFKHHMQLSRQINDIALSEAVVQSSLQSEDMRPQKLVKEDPKKPFPHLNLFPSNAESSSDFELQSHRFPALIQQKPAEDQNRNNLHNFSRSSSFSHMPGSSFNQSTIYPNIMLTQDSSRIKLPKLSFNDLLQDSRHYDSQQQAHSSGLPTTANRSTVPVQQKILVEDDQLTQSEMSAFSAMHERQNALFEKVPVKRGELYSEKLLLTNTRKKSAPRKNGGHQSVDKWKFPKIQLLSTGGEQSERQEITHKVQKKENVIDTNGHLAEAFRIRSLKMKAWKACLIHRMNAIRKTHASKLSHTYNTRKALYKHLALWKLYVKRILPEEKVNAMADRHHEWSLLCKVFNGMREVATRRRELTAKLVSTRFVLQSQLKKRAFALFRVGIAQSQIKSLKVYQAEQSHMWVLKQKVVKAMMIYRVASKRHKAQKLRQHQFNSHLLLGKSMIAWRNFTSKKRASKQQLVSAKNFFGRAQDYQLQSKALSVLWHYAKHEKQLRRAQYFRTAHLLFHHFKIVKYHLLVRRGVRNQLRSVDNFRFQKLKLKVLLGLRDLSYQTLDHLHVVYTYLKRAKLRKTFRALLRYSQTHSLRQPPLQPGFVKCAQVLLSNSFHSVMETVWKEFPTQKFEYDNFGRKNEVLNYLGLSRNESYRQYFSIANQVLRRERVERAFFGLKRHWKSIRSFRQRLKDNVVSLVFSLLRKQCEKQVLLRTIIREKDARRSAIMLNDAFYALEKHRLTMRAFYQVAQQRQKDIQRHFMQMWLLKTDRIRRAKTDDVASTQIFRQRYLSKYLSMWLRRLHIALKKKHLQTIQRQFLATKGLRKQYFTLWRSEFTRHRYLESQSKSIETHQGSMAVFKAFTGWREYSEDRRQLRMREVAADQEYRYWIAKNAIAAFKQGIVILQTQKELDREVSMDFKVKVAKKIFGVLESYKNYRREKKIQSYVMMESVTLLEKKRLLKRWRGKLQAHTASKLLAYTYQRAELRQALLQIQGHLKQQDESVSLMREFRHESLLKQQTFRLLRENSISATTLRKMHTHLKELTLKNTKRSHFARWRGLFTSLRKSYITYAFIVIQLKNLTVRPYLKALLDNARHQKYKKEARGHFRKQTLAKVLRVMNVKCRKALATQQVGQAIIVAKRFVKMQAAYKTWREGFLKERLLKERADTFENKVLYQVFQCLKVNSMLGKQARTIQASKHHALLLVKREFGLKRFVSLARARLLIREKFNKATIFNAQRMFQSACLAWFRYAKQNRTLIKKSLHLNKKHKANVKSKTLRTWFQRAAPALKRLIGAKKVLQIRNTKLLKPRFHQWIQEMLFLRDLDQRVEQFRLRVEFAQKRQQVQSFRRFNVKAKLNRQRSKDVREYRRKRVQFAVVQLLRGYALSRKQTRSMQLSADLQYSSALKRVNFFMMRELLRQQALLKVQSLRLKKWQVKTYARPAIAKLRQNRQQSRSLSVLNSFAYEYLKQSLLTKSLLAFKEYLLRTADRRQLTHQARVFHAKSLCVKTVRSLEAWAQYSSVMSMKRQALTQAVQTVDLQVASTEAFLRLKLYAQDSRIEKLKAFQSMLKNRLRRVLNGMKWLCAITKERRALLANFKTASLGIALNKWKQAYHSETTVKVFKQRAEANLKHKVFSVLKRRTEIIHLVSQVRMSGVRSLQLRAFSCLKGYHGMVREFRHRQTLRRYNHSLEICSKFLATLAIRTKKSNISKQFRMKQDGKKMQRAIFALKQHLLLAQTSQLIQSKQALITKKCIMQGLMKKYQASTLRKQSLQALVNRQSASNLTQTFKQWRKQAYYNVLIEKLHTHIFKESEVDLQAGILREWTRYSRFKRDKAPKGVQLTTVHNTRLQRDVFKLWQTQSTAALFGVKMKKVFARKQAEALNKLADFSKREQTLQALIHGRVQERATQVKRDFLTMWLIARLNATNHRVANTHYQTKLLKNAVSSLSHYRLHILETKYQMLRVIQHFSERRPELLVSFSKLFLHLSHQENTQARMCSTALAKYALEKWKVSRQRIRVGNVNNQKAQRSYLFHLFTKGLSGLREGAAVRAEKRSLKLSCMEFYTINTLKRSLLAFLINQQHESKKKTLKQLEQHYHSVKNRTDKHQTLALWYNLTVTQQKLKDFTWQLSARRNQDTLNLAFAALKNHCIRKQTQQMRYEHATTSIEQSILRRYLVNMVRAYTQSVRQKEHTDKLTQIAEQFRDFHILRRIFARLRNAVKDEQIRGKYSRLYSVFTAWRYHVKEKKLLSKYLNECHYTENRRTSQRSKSKQRSGSSNSRGASQQRRALVDLDIQTVQNQRIKGCLSPYSGYENNVASVLTTGKANAFTPTLGQAIQFPQLMLGGQHSQSQDKPQYGVLTPHVNSHETDENFNSMNSPDGFQVGTTISPNQRFGALPRQNPRYSNLLSASELQE